MEQATDAAKFTIFGRSCCAIWDALRDDTDNRLEFDRELRGFMEGFSFSVFLYARNSDGMGHINMYYNNVITDQQKSSRWSEEAIDGFIRGKHFIETAEERLV